MPIPGRPPSLINPPGGCSLPSALPLRPRGAHADRPAARAGRRAGRRTRSPACCPRRPPAAVDRPEGGRGARRGGRRGRRPRRRAGSGRHPRDRGARAVSGEPLIEVRDLVKHFPLRSGIIFQRQVGAVQAVDGVSFDVFEGETLGLVGETGCGKSHHRPPAHAPARAHERRDPLQGRDIAHLSRRQLKPLRRDMQMIFQDPYSSLNPRKTVGSIIGEPFIIHGIEPDEGKRRKLVQGLMDQVGPEPRALQPAAARVLRRPAPAHRRRARDRAQAEARRRRRARLGARRLDPGADPQPAARAAARARADDHLHRPRPVASCATCATASR